MVGPLGAAVGRLDAGCNVDIVGWTLGDTEGTTSTGLREGTGTTIGGGPTGFWNMQPRDSLQMWSELQVAPGLQHPVPPCAPPQPQSEFTA